MVLYPEFEVKISKEGKAYYVRAVSSITVTLSAQLPCDEAEVIIPTRKDSALKDSDLKAFDKGDKIEIKLGYKDQTSSLDTVFTGYITSTSPDFPMRITAHDAFYRAKERNRLVTKDYGASNDWIYRSDIAQELIKVVLELTPYTLDEKGPGEKQHSISFNSATVAEAFQQLVEGTGWIYFCIPGTEEIYFGPPAPEMNKHLASKYSKFSRELFFRVGSSKAVENPWGNVISCAGLSFQENDKQYNKVECELFDNQLGNTSVCMVAPDNVECEKNEKTDGVNRIKMLYTFKQGSAGSQKAKADSYLFACNELSRLMKQEVTGNFTTFGNPQLVHSQKIRLEWTEDQHQSSWNGYYEVTKVVFNYSPQTGFRMTVSFRKWLEDANQQGGSGE